MKTVILYAQMCADVCTPLQSGIDFDIIYGIDRCPLNTFMINPDPKTNPKGPKHWKDMYYNPYAPRTLRYTHEHIFIMIDSLIRMDCIIVNINQQFDRINMTFFYKGRERKLVYYFFHYKYTEWPKGMEDPTYVIIPDGIDVKTGDAIIIERVWSNINQNFYDIFLVDNLTYEQDDPDRVHKGVWHKNNTYGIRYLSPRFKTSI